MVLNDTILLFINILHIIIILLILIIPFASSNYLLLLYIISIPFIILHWVVNNNTCCLTLMEQSLREKINGEVVDRNETYMHKIMAPIYDFKKDNNSLSIFIYSITIFLWLYACGHLYLNYKNSKINDFRDLFPI